MSTKAPHFGFDMDGTLIDTADFFEQACLKAFEAHDIPLTHEEFQAQFGTGKRTVEWLADMGITDKKVISGIIKVRDDIVLALLESETRWMPGASETLCELRRRQESLFIVTNANNEYRNAVRRCLPEIDEFVTDVIGPEEAGGPKPKPDGILRAVRESGKSVEDFVYVGDQLFDYMGSRNAGVQFCVYDAPHAHHKAVTLSDIRVGGIPELLEIDLHNGRLQTPDKEALSMN